MNNMVICIKGAGEIASAVAWRLYMANMRKIVMLECPDPLAIRRHVSFCQAVYDGTHSVEDVEATLCKDTHDVKECWHSDMIAVAVDPTWQMIEQLPVTIVIDAILAKKNLGTSIDDAELVIGLGPGFIAKKNVHFVIETNRGHNLGRIITSESAERNTGIPGSIGGYTEERVLRAPAYGRFRVNKAIGDMVVKGDIVGMVGNTEVIAGISGVLRGILRSDSDVHLGLKIGDIDPRGEKKNCHTISDKARAISGSVLEVVMRVFPPYSCCYK